MCLDVVTLSMQRLFIEILPSHFRIVLGGGIDRFFSFCILILLSNDTDKAINKKNGEIITDRVCRQHLTHTCYFRLHLLL